MGTALGLGGLATRLILTHDLRTVGVLTAESTGNPALGSLDLSAADVALCVQYSHPAPGLAHRPDHDLAHRMPLLRPWASRMDLVLVDPFHTYEASVRAILAGAEMVRPGGLLLVHDCLPPPDLVADQYVPGNWCGVTFAAFRDLCVGNEGSWCTVANDFGIGALRVPADGIRPVTPADAWTAGSHEQYVRTYLADPYRLMRAVEPDSGHDACERLLRGEDPDGLLAPFPGWDTARARAHESTDLTATQWQELRAENARLRHQNAEQDALLIEASRPTWQARAMVHSVPRALRERLSRRVHRRSE